MPGKGERFWETLGTGEIASGFWEAFPVLAARGAADGPTLLVTAGVHGDEYEGPEAIYRLFSNFEQTRFRGQAIGLPICNSAAWEARSRVSPGDGVNLNRVFPGSDDSPTARIAETIFERFVRSCDALIDLHSGGIAFDHLPLIGWYRSDAAGRAERLARRFEGRLHPWILPDAPGVLSYEAQRIGKIALGAEWRGGGRLDNAGAESYLSGLRRLMMFLEMLPRDESPESDERAPIGGDYQNVTRDGLFVASVMLGQTVNAGDRLGILRDLQGRETAVVTAERSGVVAGLVNIPLLRRGDRVAYIG